MHGTSRDVDERAGACREGALATQDLELPFQDVVRLIFPMVYVGRWSGLGRDLSLEEGERLVGVLANRLERVGVARPLHRPALTRRDVPDSCLPGLHDRFSSLSDNFSSVRCSALDFGLATSVRAIFSTGTTLISTQTSPRASGAAIRRAGLRGPRRARGRRHPRSRVPGRSQLPGCETRSPHLPGLLPSS